MVTVGSEFFILFSAQCRDETIMINLLHASSEARSYQSTTRAYPIPMSYVREDSLQDLQ